MVANVLGLILVFVVFLANIAHDTDTPIRPLPTRPLPTQVQTPTVVLPTATPRPIPTPTVMPTVAPQAEIIQLVNAYRLENGLRPLREVPLLNQLAQFIVRDNATHNAFSHTDSLGRSAYERALAFGYTGGVGENLAAGTQTAQQTLAAWKASPGHNANLLFPTYTEIGFGYYRDPASQYGSYWALTFGLH